MSSQASTYRREYLADRVQRSQPYGGTVSLVLRPWPRDGPPQVKVEGPRERIDAGNRSHILAGRMRSSPAAGPDAGWRQCMPLLGGLVRLASHWAARVSCLRGGDEERSCNAVIIGGCCN